MLLPELKTVAALLVAHRSAVKAVVALLIVLGVFVVAWYYPQLGSRWFRGVECWLRRVGRRRNLAVTLVGGIAFAISAAFGLIHLPLPDYHDEFSYLLAADTFAHGRLSNPTPPSPQHFKSPYLLLQPTYMSKYPPLQGAVLALGQVVGGHPVVGVWLSMGLMCAAICWMLQGWMPPRWALCGALVAALVLGGTYWGRSYWGGAVAATGGALLFGACRRLVRQPRSRYALVLVGGVAILATSRPYEGLLTSLPIALVLLGWMCTKSRPPVRLLLRRVVAPVGCGLLCLAGAMAWYNLAITGNPLLLPYQASLAQHGRTVKAFAWTPNKAANVASNPQFLADGGPPTRKAAFRQLPVWGPVWLVKKKAKKLWRFYLGPILTLPLIMLPWVLRDRWQWLALLTCLLVVSGIFAVVSFHEHYAAPLTGIVFVMVVQAMRHLRTWRWRRRAIGRAAVRVIPLVCLLLLAASFGKALVWGSKQDRGFPAERVAVLTTLENEPGKHLVFVRYGPNHSRHEEWVYNKAELDSAKVVWAHDLRIDRNRQLLSYFKNRRPWLLLVDMGRSPPRLLPYSGALSAADQLK